MSADDYRQKGPAVGEPFPDVRLPDQTGAPVDLHGARRGRPVLVVFYRSARWWPFCKTQLVELQKITGNLDARGSALFAISYDSLETLAGFSAKQGITSPLLSNQGSRVIRELEILDEHLDQHQAEFRRPTRDDQWGVAYPSVFQLDSDGIVVRKWVYRNYRIRDTGPGLFEDMLGGTASAHGAEAAADGEVVQIRAYLDSPTYRWYQRRRIIIEVVYEIAAVDAPANP